MPSICHITSVHPRYDVRIFYKECASLSRIGDVTLLCSDQKPSEINNNVHIISVDFRPHNRVERILFAKKAFFRHAMRIDADVYHFHDPELLPLGVKLRKKNKIVIYDVHEDYPGSIRSKHWIPAPLRGIVSATVASYEIRAASKLDQVICATDHIADRFKKKGIQTVTVNNYPLLSEKSEEITPWADRENACCYIGGLSRIRGIFEILRAIEITKTTLHLCGTFSSAKEEEQARSMPGWQYVKYHGFSSRDQVYEVMNRSKVGLVLFHPVSNHIHALPTKLFEYMLGELPVIASDIFADIVEKNNCGICVDPFNTDKIANAIQEMLQSDTARDMGTAGMQAVFSQYNWDNEKIKLYDVYTAI